MPSACNVATIVVWLCSIDPIARSSLLCSRATTQTKKNSKNAQAIVMPSACNIANIVVWLCSMDTIARSSLLSSSEQGVMEGAKRSG
jgi:hypothetical protein